MLTQHIIGGYMFLRALMGPTEVLTAFYLQPELIRALMDGWFRLADTALTKVQAHITLDEIFLAEDTCYRNGLLISPELFREFLMPYFQQLLSNAPVRAKSEHIYLGRRYRRPGGSSDRPLPGVRHGSHDAVRSGRGLRCDRDREEISGLGHGRRLSTSASWPKGPRPSTPNWSGSSRS